MIEKGDKRIDRCHPFNPSGLKTDKIEENKMYGKMIAIAQLWELHFEVLVKDH